MKKTELQKILNSNKPKERVLFYIWENGFNAGAKTKGSKSRSLKRILAFEKRNQKKAEAYAKKAFSNLEFNKKWIDGWESGWFESPEGRAWGRRVDREEYEREMGWIK